MRNTDRPHRTCDHRFHTEYEHDESLAGLLDHCGHYYAHRIGGSRRGQNSVMAWLAHNPDVTQKELSEGLNIMPASLSEVLMKLERKGYVTRVKDENDRRFVRVRLTEEGENALSEPAGEVIDPFASLSTEEQETLKLLLGKLLADWQTRYAVDRMCQTHSQYGLHGDEHPGHCNEHPKHGNEHPRHGDEHPGHRREHFGDHIERENDRGDGRHDHGHH